MQETMLKVGNKRLRTQMIVVAVILLICAGLYVPSLLAANRKAVELDSLREGMAFEDYLELEEYDRLEGKWVSLDVQYVLDTYYKKHNSSSTSTIDNYGYLVYDEESGYMLGIYVNRHESLNTWEDLEDDTYDYLSGGTDTPPAPITIEGTFRKMTGSELNNFKNTANDWGEKVFDTDYTDMTLMYTIDTSEPFISSDTMKALVGMVAWLAIVWLVVDAIMFFTKAPVKKIRKYMNKNGLNETELDSDFASAKIVKNVHVGHQCTYVRTGSRWSMFKNTDLVWAYYYRRTGRYSVSQIIAYHYDKKASYINLSRSVSEEILKYYAQILPQIIVGYSSDLEREFMKDYNTFLSHKYANAQLRTDTRTAEPEPEFKASRELFGETGDYGVRFTYVSEADKVQTIKDVREITGLGLAEAKEIVDNAGIVLRNVSYAAAEEAAEILRRSNNSVEVVGSSEL